MGKNENTPNQINIMHIYIYIYIKLIHIFSFPLGDKDMTPRVWCRERGNELDCRQNTGSQLLS